MDNCCNEILSQILRNEFFIKENPQIKVGCDEMLLAVNVPRHISEQILLHEESELVCGGKKKSQLSLK